MEDTDNDSVLMLRPGLQLHGVTGVDKVLGVNMLEVIETSAAPYLEPGETQDECVQYLVSAPPRGRLRTGAGGTQVIVASPFLSALAQAHQDQQLPVRLSRGEGLIRQSVP